MPNCRVLIGCPASGKSQFIKDYITEDCIILSADKIREELYGDANIQGGYEVWSLFYKRLEEAVFKKQNIIIDNTNCKAKYRKEILKRLSGDYVPQYIVLMTSLKWCKLFNASRSRQVPEEVIESMYRNLHMNMEELKKEVKLVYFHNKMYDDRLYMEEVEGIWT